MKILITNDDGINSPVLPKLAEWAKTKGEVFVVAPKVEQSGKSHGINIIDKIEIKKINLVNGATCYSVDSTPADCVRFAVIGLNQSYDLVISGINRGFNLGKDIMYSGTVGAIFEAGGFGINSIALSTGFESFENALNNLDQVYDFIMQNKLFDYNLLYNVNFPLSGNKIYFTRQGGSYFSDDFVYVDNDMFLQSGKCVHEDKKDFNIDTDCVVNGNISITPLTMERTNLQIFEQLKNSIK